MRALPGRRFGLLSTPMPTPRISTTPSGARACGTCPTVPLPVLSKLLLDDKNQRGTRPLRRQRRRPPQRPRRRVVPKLPTQPLATKLPHPRAGRTPRGAMQRQRIVRQQTARSLRRKRRPWPSPHTPLWYHWRSERVVYRIVVGTAQSRYASRIASRSALCRLVRRAAQRPVIPRPSKAARWTAANPVVPCSAPRTPAPGARPWTARPPSASPGARSPAAA
mmetsp:Transcript_22030/g.53635  ORF Transcript_22030/g.53635 Transcript_22030/m.53635 type:complete len:221 (-) Transcript_22030:1020-1682(-)